MAAALIIAAVILLVAGLRIRRLQEMRANHPLVWPTLILAAAMPAFVAWKVLDPAVPTGGAHTGKVSPVVDTTNLEIPEGHALLVTATLGEASDEPNSDRTAYALRIRGEGWEQAASGTMKRSDAKGSGMVVQGESVADAQKRSSRLGEDLQDRFDLKGSGPVRVDVTNWTGTGATTLDLAVVESPPPAVILWVLVAVVALLGIFIEVKFGADQFAGDVAFLAMWAIFLRDGVTPLDDWQEVVKAVLPAALLGMLGVGGAAYGINRYLSSKDEKASKAAAPPEPEKPEPEPEPDGRRRRRRKSSP